MGERGWEGKLGRYVAPPTRARGQVGGILASELSIITTGGWGQVMKRIAIGLILAGLLIVAPCARAQEAPVEQMTVPEALDYLRGAIISQGKVVYRSDATNTASGRTESHLFSQEASQVNLIPSTCSMNYHYVETLDGKVTYQGVAGFYFRDVDAITVGDVAEWYDQGSYQAGNVNMRTTTTPEVYVVVIHRNGTNRFYFYSRTIADQAARAASRLRALCRPN